MQKKSDLIRLVIWVTCGVLAGVIICLSIQQFFSSKAGHVSTEASGDKGTAETEAAAPAAGTEAAGTEAAAPAAAPKEPASATYASPHPVSTALSVLGGDSSSQNGTGSAANSQNSVNVPAGQSYSQTASGYAIYTGGRAVDSPPAFIPAPVQKTLNGSVVVVGQQEELPPQPVGRNGLMANPCVDPPSVHGRAYSR